MNKGILMLIVISIVIGCGKGGSSLESSITQLENERNNMKQNDANYTNVTDNLYELYDSFTRVKVEDEKVPLYLIKLAEYHNSKNNIARGAKTFELFVERFPNHKESPTCLMKAAILFEGPLNDKVHSKKLYTRLVEEYPNTDEAIEAQKNLNIIDKPLDEVIKMFEKQNSQEQ